MKIKIEAQKKIAIIGFGYVGKAIAKMFQDHYHVYVYDPFLFPQVQESDWFSAVLPDGKEYGAANPYAQYYLAGQDKVNECDMAIICVPTPMSDDGSADLSAVREILGWLKTPLILTKSTVPPGTSWGLSQEFNKPVCFSPEYIGEGKYFTPAWRYLHPTKPESHSFVIVGGPQEHSSRIMDYFQRVMSPDTHFILTESIVAELVKYMENSYFATKVTFANEWFDICQSYGVDYKLVRELWALDNRVDPMHTLVFPDKRGYGGKCLPKDVNAIIKAVEKQGYSARLLKQVVESNVIFNKLNQKNMSEEQNLAGPETPVEPSTPVEPAVEAEPSSVPGTEATPEGEASDPHAEPAA